MPVIADTTYPRLAATPGTAELAEAFTPTQAELSFALRRTRRPAPRLALLVLLKTFQRLGYFVRIAEIPPAVVVHVAAAAGLADVTATEIAAYDGTTYRTRLMALVRGILGVTGYERGARGIAVQASLEAARTRDDLADIINVAIEELVRHRYELPAFGTLLKIARTARALVNRGYHRQVAAAMAPEIRHRLEALLLVPEDGARSAWDQLKTIPSIGLAGPGTSARSPATRPSSTAHGNVIWAPSSAMVAGSAPPRPRAR